MQSRILSEQLIKILSKFSSYSFLPHQCALCRLTFPSALSRSLVDDPHHSLTTKSSLWCESCVELIYQQAKSPKYSDSYLCARCGLPITAEVEQCGQCLSEPPPWDRLFCIGDYQSPLKDAIHQLKYHRHYWLAQNLSSLLLPIIPTPAPECIPVPLHWARHLKRSFNQSELLAQHLVHQWKKQQQDVILSPILQRTANTQAQKGLDKKQRQRNLNNAFELIHPPTHKHVALIDDVVTTGSTLAPICKLLRDVGVEKIDVYCLCRTALLI